MSVNNNRAISFYFLYLKVNTKAVQWGMTFFTSKPVGLYLLCFVFTLFLQIAYPLTTFENSTIYLSIIGISLFVLIAIGNLWIVKTYNNHNTSYDPSVEPKNLIVDGPYKYSRNPIYLLLVLSFFAFGALTGCLWFVLNSMLFVVVIHYRVVLKEETILEKLFADEYEAYRSNTPRWFLV
jgi:protein-S-isoprenylcysteine O-methyltransferase Ste14